jgi:hypothetical protein
MTLYLNGTPAHLSFPSSPLFVRLDGSAVSLDWIKGQTTAFLIRLGMNHGDFTGSSWRAGGAISARDAGISDSVIKVLGRWESAAYLNYLPVAESNLAEAAIKMGRAASVSG